MDSNSEIDLDTKTRLEIDAKVEEYEIKLRQELGKTEKESVIERKTKSFREKLLEYELEDVGRDTDSIRREERTLINLNLWLSLLISGVVIVLAMVFSSHVKVAASAATQFIASNLNWFYVLISSGFLIYLLYLAFSRYGHVVLGDPDSKPEFSNISWYSMLFSAGMGTGILFWGAAEPLVHFRHPPVADPGTVHAAKMAMAYSAFHWGLHAWAIYTVCAVGVAYYGFRKRKKYLVSSSIMDVTQNRTARKGLKAFSDLVATLAIIFGVAASLGMGLLLIGSGFRHMFDVNAANAWGYLIIIAVMTGLFIVSSVTGLHRGIKYLSNLNLFMALLLLLFVFLAGPTLFTAKLFVDSIGQYIQYLPQFSFRVAPFTSEYQKWMGDWTLTYFTWWIAWSPFVGIFIARISKGRTIRELIVGSLLIPAVFCILWFSVFGGTALHMEMGQGAGLADAVSRDVTIGLFAFLERLPLPALTSAVAIFLVFTFLITSADSATFVISMMTSEGDLEPKQGLKILWGILLAVLTYLLVIGGGIDALQAAALTCAFPFSLVLILIIVSVTIRLSIQLKKKRV